MSFHHSLAHTNQNLVMGVVTSFILNRFFSKEEMRVLMIGIDAAGKTTILHKLKISDTVTKIVPTAGYNVEIVEVRNLRFIVYDCGGQTSIRPIWQCFSYSTAAVIYVVDSTDRERIEEAESELSKILKNEYLTDAVILVLANKQDLPNAVDALELAKQMRMQDKKHEWRIQATCALTGNGLSEGLESLHQMLIKRK